MHFHLSECASVPDFSDDSIFNPLFMTFKKKNEGLANSNIKTLSWVLCLCSCVFS